MLTQLPTDYKALVYIFLYGGNQSYNTIVPYTQAAYDEYKRTRGNLALPRDATTTIPEPFQRVYSGTMPGLIPLNGAALDGNQYGMHPECTGLASLFNSGKVAVMCNIGPLVQPTTLSQYFSGSVDLPAQLFSHYDQTEQWEIGTSGSTIGSGWGGKIADLYKSIGYTSELEMNMHPLTQNTFGSGTTTNSYAIGTGVPPESYVSRYQGFYLGGNRYNVNNTLKLMALSDLNPMVKGYAEIKESFKNKSITLGKIIAGTGNLLKPSSAWTTTAVPGQAGYGTDTSTSGFTAAFSEYPDNENARISVTNDPFEGTSVVWECKSIITPTNKITVDGVDRIRPAQDGGFNSSTVPADHTKKYRHLSWIKRTGDPDVFTITGSITAKTLSADALLTVESLPTGKLLMERQFVFVGTTYIGYIQVAESNGVYYQSTSNPRWPSGVTPTSSNFLIVSAGASIAYPSGTTITIKSSGGYLFFGPGPAGSDSTITNLIGDQATYPYFYGLPVYSPANTGEWNSFSAASTAKQHYYPSGYCMPKDRWYLFSFTQYPSTFNITIKNSNNIALSALPTSGAVLGDTYKIDNNIWVYTNAPTTNDSTTLEYNYYSYRGFTRYGLDPEDGVYMRVPTTGAKIKVAGPGVPVVASYLTTTINATVGTITVGDVTKFSQYGGLVKIESEVISYTGINTGTNQLTGCQRGVNNTGGATHTASGTSMIVQSLYEVMFPIWDAVYKSTPGTVSMQHRLFNYYNQEGTKNNTTNITLTNVTMTSNGTITYTASTALKLDALVTISNLSGVTIDGYNSPTTYKVTSVISSTSVVLGKIPTGSLTVTVPVGNPTGAITGTITATNPNEYFTKFLFARPRIDLIDGNQPSLDTIVLNGGSSTSEIVTSFDGGDGYGSIGPQLSQVFNVIRNSSALTTLQDERQIFFVNMYGFDNHDDEGYYHPLLMRTLSKNVTEFYNALLTAGIANKVTISIQSEFARTLAPNGTGDGSDHAWGGYALVLGGAVNGYSAGVRSGFYGTPPSIKLGSANTTTINPVTLSNVNIDDTIGTITFSSAVLRANDRVTIVQTGGSGTITGYTNPTTYKVLSVISSTKARLVTLDGAEIATTTGGITGTVTVVNPNPLDVDGAGRIIPTLSTDQHAATLATWFGVNAGDLPTLFPNLNNFTPTNLGFMA